MLPMIDSHWPISGGHLELDIAAVQTSQQGYKESHHQNDIPFPSALETHHSKFSKPFPIVQILQTTCTHSASEPLSFWSVKKTKPKQSKKRCM